MSASTRAPRSVPAGAGAGQTRTRRAPDPARRRLGMSVVFVLVGSFLPWMYTGLQPVLGAGGPGLWTFCAALIALGGLILPFRRAAAVQAALLAVVAVVLPVWQVIHMLGLVGFAGWYPGPGLVLVFTGGVLAAGCARRLFRPLPATEA